MKKTIIICLFFMTGFTPLVQAHNGIYATAASGLSFLSDMPDPQSMNASSVNQKNFPAFRASIGYVHQILFTRFYLGFEIGKGLYSDYRYQINSSELKARSSTLEFLGVIRMRLPLHNYIYTKLGGVRNTMSIIYQNSKQKETRIQPMISLGIIHTLFPHLFFDLGYTISFGQKISTFIPMSWKAPTTQTMLVGLGVSFF